MRRPAVNHYVCPEGLPCVAFLDEAARRGYGAVGLTRAALSELPAHRMRQELAARGLHVSSVNSALLSPERTDGMDDNAWLLDAAAELDAPLNIIVTGTAAMPLSQARNCATDVLAGFAGRAQQRGVRIVLEPLHPLHARGRSCVNTLAQVAAIREQVPTLAVNADFFHLWWDPDFDRLLLGDWMPVGLLQVCDVAPAEDLALPRRVPLDEGFIDWRACLRSAMRAFPDTPVELELFADQLPGRAWVDLLRTNASALAPLLGDDHAHRPD